MRLAMPVEEPLPNYRYWSPMSPVLNQQGGVCVGAGWSGWMRCMPTRTLDGPDMYEIYRQAVLLDEWTDNDRDGETREFGTSVRAGAQVLQRQGRIGEYVWAFDVETIVRWLLTKGPVVIGTNWYTGMLEVGAQGLVHARGSVEGGHCTYLLGANRKSERVRGMNSWSKDWGRGGRFSLSFDDLALLIAEEGEACAAVEVSR